MKMRSMPTEIYTRRGGERGAALVTALLVAMLMLAAGGALIATAGMSAANAVDATAEAQAYYAADAGLQATLNVLRRNKPSNPAGTEADFHKLLCGAAATCTNTGSSLALWLPYNEDGVVELSNSPQMTYAVTVTDPSKDSAYTFDADYYPRYLLVRSVGRGPKGATKVLEMMVRRFKFDYAAPAPLVLRESEDNLSHVALIPGAGQPNLYSGTDVSEPAVTLPAVGVGNTTFLATTDFNIATTATASETITGGVGVVGTAATPWPSVVADAPAAAETLQGLRELASSTACPGNSDALSGFTFIEGDCTLGPQNSGSGFLAITGTLTMSGNFNFSGLIFVLGEGHVIRSGGGGGTVQGGILAAKFAGNGSGGFGGVVFDTSGGGNSKILYNSQAIEEALALLGPRAVGLVEK